MQNVKTKRLMLFARVDEDVFAETNRLANKFAPTLSDYVREAVLEKNKSNQEKEKKNVQ